MIASASGYYESSQNFGPIDVFKYYLTFYWRCLLIIKFGGYVVD